MPRVLASNVMSKTNYMLFGTVIGTCGIAWTEYGIRAVQLPEINETATRARLLARFPGATEAPPSPEASRARDDIVAMLHGMPVDVSDIRLDMARVPAFHQQVYQVASATKPGETLTFSEVAARLGMPATARAVGQALGKNPLPIVIPCHRILAKGGKGNSFSAHGAAATKMRLLAIEGFRPCGAPAHFD
jgi:methylated-DNA-[protein]-cysteine S-methyltransferase